MIGHLFRVSLLSDNIIHSCVQDLFGDPSGPPDEEKTECLCAFLVAAGPQLETGCANSPLFGRLIKNYFKVTI